MAHYIDKDALVAEIEKQIKLFGSKDYKCSDRLTVEERLFTLNSIKKFIETLEVKEVDLKKEYKEFVEEDPVYSKLVNGVVGKAIAKHFFELGINTRQNISVDITNIDKVIEKNGVDPNSKEAKMFKESYYIALEKLKAQKGE